MKLEITAEELVWQNKDRLDLSERIYAGMTSKAAIKLIIGNGADTPGVNKDPKISTTALTSKVMVYYYEAKAIVYALASRLAKEKCYEDAAFLFRRKVDSALKMNGKCLGNSVNED